MSGQNIQAPIDHSLQSDKTKITGTQYDDLQKRALDVNPLQGPLQGLIYDAGTVAYPTDTQVVHTLQSGGNNVATITLNYTDDTKCELSSWSVTRP